MDYLHELNNVRNVCFIKDIDIHTSVDILQNESCIILNNNNNSNSLNYLFKNDNNILSYIK